MRQHHDPKHIESLLARRERRGLTWFQLAAESGVSAGTLQWWHRRLRGTRKGRRRKAGSFVAVAIREPAAAVTGSAALEVMVRPGVCIRVPVGFDPDHLRRVVEVLESAC